MVERFPLLDTMLLPGEDRSFGDGLFVDLVPAACWFTDVLACVPGEDGERLLRMAAERAGGRCETCDRRLPEPEIHERWDYDHVTVTQRLRRLICLCAECHMVTHFGLAVHGAEKAALAHLSAVTAMPADEAREHVEESYRIWRMRSRRNWRLDLSILTKAGVTPKPPPESHQRARAAERGDVGRPPS